MKTIRLTYLIFLTILFSCQKENDDSIIIDTFTITGNISSDNQNVSNVEITLDGEEHYQTISDDNGDFTISDIDKGLYNMNLKKSSSDSSFVGNSYQIVVKNDTTISNLELPNPVILFAPENISSQSATIRWSSCDLSGFYEYKIYRKNNQGLDENTGELIYIGVNRLDTTFTDNTLLENTDYYYRVYVLNNYGKLGGSNIVNVKTTEGNYVENGSFELFDNDSIADNWTYRDNGAFDFADYSKVIYDPTAPDGDYVLSIDIPIYHYALSFGDLYQLINNKYIQQNTKYELSFWVKSIELTGGAQCQLEINDGTSYSPERVIYVSSTDKKDEWIKYSTQFYGNESTSYTLQLLTTCSIPYNNEPYKIQIDNIIIRKIEE